MRASDARAPDGPVAPLDATASRAGAFAAHPAWTRAAAEHLVAPGSRLVRVHRGADELMRLHVCAPRPGRALRRPAHAHLSLAEPDVAPRAHASALLAAIDATLASVGRASPAWRAAGVADDSPLVRAIRARTGTPDGPVDAGGWALRHARDSAWFDLAGPSSPVPGKLRRNLKRLRSRVTAAGGAEPRLVSTGAATDGAEALTDAFDRFVRIEASGWKSGGSGTGSGTGSRTGSGTGSGTAIGDDAATLGFYRALLSADGLAPGIVELVVGRRTVAAKLVLRTADTLHVLKTAYDEAVAGHSPGSLLLEALLADAAERGIARVSLVTSPAWAARWHPHVVPAWHVVRYADSVGGRLAARVDRARAAALRRYRSLGRAEKTMAGKRP